MWCHLTYAFVLSVRLLVAADVWIWWARMLFEPREPLLHCCWSSTDRTFQAHLTNVENRDKIVTYIVLPSLLSPSAQTVLGGEICITKGLSWHTLARVIVRAPVSHTADLKPVAGSSAVGAMGKAWVLEGKCRKFHSVGWWNTQTIPQEVINAPSVNGCLWHCELQPTPTAGQTGQSVLVSLVSMVMT